VKLPSTSFPPLRRQVGGRVVGVSVRNGGNVYDISAPLVISDAGIMNTFRKLLPQDFARKNFMKKDVLKTTRSGLALMSVFIGLDGTKEELGLKASNGEGVRGQK